MSSPAIVNDPWLDPFTALAKESDYFQDLSAIATEEGFGAPAAPAVDAPGAPAPPIPLAELTEPVVPPPVDPELDGTPRVFPVDGGGTLTMEKGSKGWQATLTAPGVKDQVYYGKTKDELLVNFGKAQLHATKKIRSQDEKLKLGGEPTPTSQPLAPNSPITVRELTADERFEYKTLLDSDPVRALDYYNEKRFGLSPEQFAQRLNESTVTRTQTAESLANATASQFVLNNKDFYPDPEGVNYLKMVRYLGRQYMNRTVSKTNASQTVLDMQQAGHWTIENLEAAKDDLNESGLLLEKPAISTPTQEPPAPVAVTPQAPPAAPVVPPVPAGAITPTERPRAANLGLREAGAPATPAPAPAPSVEDPSRLSDAELEQVFTNLRQTRARAR